MPRAELKKRIAKRLRARLRQGMIKEVQSLIAKGVSIKRLDDLGLEYRAISRYLQGRINKREMVVNLEKEIAKFAKRQMTWFARKKNIIWITAPEEALSKVRDWLAL